MQSFERRGRSRRQTTRNDPRGHLRSSTRTVDQLDSRWRRGVLAVGVRRAERRALQGPRARRRGSSDGPAHLGVVRTHAAAVEAWAIPAATALDMRAPREIEDFHYAHGARCFFMPTQWPRHAAVLHPAALERASSAPVPGALPRRRGFSASALLALQARRCMPSGATQA